MELSTGPLSEVENSKAALYRGVVCLVALLLVSSGVVAGTQLGAGQNGPADTTGGVPASDAGTASSHQQSQTVEANRASAPENNTASSENTTAQNTGPEPGEELWNISVTEITTAPTVAGGMVFIGDNGGHVIAADAQTGEILWNVTVGTTIGNSAPTVADGTVYIAGGLGNVSALDAETGEMQWQFEINDTVSDSTTYADGTLYVGSSNGYLYALDAETGTMQWRHFVHYVYSAPTVVDGRVFVGSSNGLYALDASVGSELWNHTSVVSRSAPTVADGTVYGSSNSYFYALDAETGEVQWNREFGYANSSPTAANGTVYMANSNNNLSAYDTETGTIQWSYDRRHNYFPDSSPTVANDTVYFGADDGLAAVDAETGNESWWYETGAGNTVASPPTVAHGIVYFSSNDGHFYAVATNHSQSSSGSRVRLGTQGHVGDRAGSLNQAPNVSVQRATVCARSGNRVRFDASGSDDPDGRISSYNWRVDGERVDASGPTLNHRFDSTGDHRVTLTVRDDDGADASTTKRFEVSPEGEAGIGVTATPVETSKPLVLSFCGEPSGELTWEFGDGATATGSNVIHAYASSGSYTVSVSDDSGQLATRTVDVQSSAIELTDVEAKRKITPIANYPVSETYEAQVEADGEDVDYVTFSLGAGNTTRDDTPDDGYTRTINFRDLDSPTYLEVTVVGTNGTSDTKYHFIPVYSTQIIPKFLDACVSFSSSESCAGETVTFSRDVSVPGLDKMNKVLDEDKEIGASAGASFDTTTLTLRASGGLSFTSPFPKVLTDGPLPAGAEFEGWGKLSGGATFVPAENYTFDVEQAPLGFSGGARATAYTDVPTPASIPVVGGVEVRLVANSSLTVKGSLRETTIGGDLDPELDSGTVTASGAALPQIGAVTCDARAGPALATELTYETSDDSITGKATLNGRAVLDCPVATGSFSASIVKTTFPRSGSTASIDQLSYAGEQWRTETDETWRVSSKNGTAPVLSGFDMDAADSGAGAGVAADSRLYDIDHPGAQSRANTHRLTADTVEDSAPDITGRNEKYTVVWGRQDPEKNVTDGQDIFVANATDGTWSDPTHLTDDRKPDIRPDIAATSDGPVAVWARADETFTGDDTANLDSPAAILSEFEIAVATAADGTWSQPTLLTNNSAIDTDPTVVTSGDRALLTWIRDADGDITTSDDRETVYALYENGTLSESRTLETTTTATSRAPDGALRLAYADGETVVTGRIGDNATITTTERYETPDANVTDVAASPEQTAWIAGMAGNQTLQATDDTGVTTLSTQPNVSGLTELSLAERDDVTLLSYRGRTPGTNGSTLYYRLERSGDWNSGRGFASGISRNETVWDSATALTRTGFTSVYLAQPVVGFDSSRPPRADLFAVNHTYKPDYSITANASRATPGDQSRVDYTLTNTGDVPTTTTTTVELVNATGVVADTTHSGLGVGESVGGQLVGTADTSGELTVRVDPANRTDELDETNNNVTVTTGRPALTIAGVSQDRRNDTVLVSTTVTNDGNVTTEGGTVTLFQDGGRIGRTNATVIRPNATRELTVSVPNDSLDHGSLATVRVAPDGAPDASNRTVRLAQPDLTIRRDGVRYHNHTEGIRTQVVVGNAGIGDVNTTVQVRNGTETVASTDLRLSGAARNTTEYRTVSLTLPERVAGEAVVIRADGRQLDANPGDNGVRVTVAPVLDAQSDTLARTDYSAGETTGGDSENGTRTNTATDDSSGPTQQQTGPTPATRTQTDPTATDTPTNGDDGPGASVLAAFVAILVLGVLAGRRYSQ